MNEQRPNLAEPFRGWAFLRTLILLLLLTEVEYHALTIMHANTVTNQWSQIIPMQAVRLATGTEWWMHSAQRVLVPKSVLFIARGGEWNFIKVWHVSIFVLLFSANATALFMLRRVKEWKPWAWQFTIIQAATFLAWQEWFVLFPNDLADSIIWFVFAYAAFTRKPWWWFAVLFVLELHNREVAVFIPLWVALDNLLPLTRGGKSWPSDIWARTVKGFAAVVAAPLGMLYTFWLRTAMLNIPWNDKEHTFKGEIINWQFNLQSLSHLLGGKWVVHPFSPNGTHTRYEMWMVVASMALTVWCWSQLERGWFKARIGLFLAAYWVTCWVFCVITELRVYQVLAPFLLLCVFAKGELDKEERKPCCI